MKPSNFPVGLGFPQKGSMKENCQKGTPPLPPPGGGGFLFAYFLAFLEPTGKLQMKLMIYCQETMAGVAVADS